MNGRTISVKCFRYDPASGTEPRFDEYRVPLPDADVSVHDCLDYIRGNLDPSLAYFLNCRLGFCRRCVVRVNGRVVLACETRVEGDMTIEPVNTDKVIRDLWCTST
jgi:succinate dehydrogenase/fumarate reductase-like Fe-S protein